MCVCVCVCISREREYVRKLQIETFSSYVGGVCIREIEGEREGERECVCVCVPKAGIVVIVSSMEVK